MGCFSLFPCFTSKNPKLNNKSVNPTTSFADQGYNKNCDTFLIKVPTQESTNLGSLQTPISKSRDDSEGNKTSVIDSDAETDKGISAEDVEIVSVGSIVNEGCGKLEDLVQLEIAKERDDAQEKENGNLILGVVERIEDERKEEKQDDSGVEVERKEEKQDDSGVEVEIEIKSDSKKEMVPKEETESPAISDSSVSSYISYPPMHRYHDHVINGDEDQVVIQEDSSESLFSLSINPRRQSRSCMVEEDDKEVNSPLKASSSPKMVARSISSGPNENDYNQKIDSLLNPIENLAQWKTLKARPSLDFHQEKENLYLEQEDIPIPVSQDPSFKVPDLKGKVKNEATVTTSLSSWLVDPEKSITVSKEESQYSTGNSFTCSDGATSWKSFEDRPILGAWTMDEVKQISARSSPRKSPSRNPDETPIIGTVGSYWSHTMQGADSSSSCTSPFGMSAKSRRTRENKALSCHSSPAKRRLERAFNKSAV